MNFSLGEGEAIEVTLTVGNGGESSRVTLDGGRVGSAGLEAKAGQDDWYGDNTTKGNQLVLKLKEFS